jgi:TolA-binding protein
MRFRNLLTIGAFAASMLVAPPASRATDEGKADTADPGSTIDAIGRRFEAVPEAPLGERPALVESVARDLTAILGSLPEDRRPGAFLLAGEVALAAGDAQAARAHFDQAARRGKDAGLRDDAEYGLARARELQGDDEGAWKAWDKWLQQHEDSALRGEVRLARAWNALRRGAGARAAEELDLLREEQPWLVRDPRVRTAGAAIALEEGDTDRALALVKGVDAPDAVYLGALAHQQAGNALAAAAAWQDVAARWPSSTLRDPAMIAKADIFLAAGSWRAAAEEYGRVAATVDRADVKAEAELRRAACLIQDGDFEAGTSALQEAGVKHAGTDVAARALYLLGETLYSQLRFDEAIVQYNRVLADYFEHELAASAQYRVARSLENLERGDEATSAYRAVVSGYPMALESPAAAYLAGAGLLERGRPVEASPYFQIVLDRYATEGTGGALEFPSPEHRELVEAALCLLEVSYWRAGRLGELCGRPHLTLQKMPASDSPWRGWALLVDADALASQARYGEAQAMLEKLLVEFEGSRLAVPANRLLAWTYGQQGDDARALETERGMKGLYASLGAEDAMASAALHEAHVLFNDKEYGAAAIAYDDFVARFPEDEQRHLALYQSGLCHERVGHDGDAVDRWETVAREAPSAPIAEKAWARAGDVYFRADHYENAKRCFGGLLENFGDTPAAARGMLRIAQCEFNAGDDAAAIALFARITSEYPGTGVARQAERGLENAMYRLGSSADGGEALARLVEEHPGSAFAADAQFEIARRLYEAEQWTEAAAAFERVVTQFPAYGSADRAHYLLGDCHARAGDDHRALEAWEQFLFFFPTSDLRASVQFRLGTLRFAERDYLRAAVDFTSVLESEPSGETRQAARFNLALCQEQLGQLEDAMAALRQYRQDAATGDSRTVDVAYHLGDLYERAGQDTAAVQEYRLALSAGAADVMVPELHWRIGSCEERSGNTDAAVAAYGRVLKSSKRGSAFRLSAAGRLAVIHEDRGDAAKAVAAYRNLLDSDDPELVAAAKSRIAELSASN